MEVKEMMMICTYSVNLADEMRHMNTRNVMLDAQFEGTINLKNARAKNGLMHSAR